MLTESGDMEHEENEDDFSRELDGDSDDEDEHSEDDEI